MAAPTKIILTSQDTGVFNSRPQTAETATKVSELLQENHENHHIFFNEAGFHNHLVHGLLTLYGLGAPTRVLEKHYKDNIYYQAKISTPNKDIIAEMRTPELFKKYLGKGKYYPEFLIFFQNEMSQKGWENVLSEFLFSGDERAEDLLARLFAGLYHPLIHLGFGVEFKQPAIMAEALAQAAVHDNWRSSYLFAAERESTTQSTKTIPEILEEIHDDRKAKTAAKKRQGSHDKINYANQWAVSESNLEQKTAEMINATVYFTAAAIFDFYMLHSITSSIFFPTFNAQQWLSTASKIRLLKLKVYTDLDLYASRQSPTLLVDAVNNYVPLKDAGWPGVWERLFSLDDDSHAVKLGRALAFGEQLMRDGGYDNEDWAKIKGGMWEKIGNMVVDSVENTTTPWVR